MPEFDDAPFQPPGSSGSSVDEPTDPFGSDATEPFGARPSSGYGPPSSSGGPAPRPGPPGGPVGYAPPAYGDGSGYTYGVGYGGYGSAYGAGPVSYGYPGYAPGPRTETMSMLALIFSILSWFLCFFYGLGIVASIAGVILGFLGRKKIRDGNGLYTGEGMALAGIIVGLVNIGFFLGGIVLFFVILATSA